MKSKVIFCDTNVIFGLFYRVISGQPIDRSSLVEAAKYYDIYISSFVLDELERNIYKEYTISYTSQDVSNFLNQVNIQIIAGNDLRDEIKGFVFDQDDAQILQDAIDIEADFLITQNVKDFDIPKIIDVYNLNIINRLPPIPYI